MQVQIGLPANAMSSLIAVLGILGCSSDNAEVSPSDTTTGGVAGNTVGARGGLTSSGLGGSGVVGGIAGTAVGLVGGGPTARGGANGADMGGAIIVAGSGGNPDDDSTGGTSQVPIGGGSQGGVSTGSGMGGDESVGGASNMAGGALAGGATNVATGGGVNAAGMDGGGTSNAGANSGGIAGGRSLAAGTDSGGAAVAGASTGGSATGGSATAGSATAGSATAGSATAGATTGGASPSAGSSGVAGAPIQLMGKVQTLGGNISRVTYDFSQVEQLADWFAPDNTITDLSLSDGQLEVLYKNSAVSGQVAVAQFRLPLRSTRLAFTSTTISSRTAGYQHVNAYLMAVWGSGWAPALGYACVHPSVGRFFVVDGSISATTGSDALTLNHAYNGDIGVTTGSIVWTFDGNSLPLPVANLYQGTDRFVLLGGYESTVQFDDVTIEGEFAVPIVGR